MTLFVRSLSATALAGLIAWTGAAFAASAPLAEDLLKPLTSAYVRAVKPGEQVDHHRDLFGAALTRVQRSYAREVDLAPMVAAALKVVEPLEPQSGDALDVFTKAMNAALAALDPHSRYLDPSAQLRERSALSGSFGGLGIQVDMAEGLVRVVETMRDTPASRAGLQRGDLIVRFDEHPVLGMTLNDATSRMRGQPGTDITLTIRRPGRADEFDVTITRATIRTQALRWNMEGDVLVLRLSSFTSSVPEMLEKAIAEATASVTPRAVVLDMRGNGGGLFRQAVTIADAFLSTGEIVSLRGRTAGNQRSWKADPSEHFAGVPMVVLLDGRSASAAELVAAALQENGRAIVMGQRSFGKGSVQSVINLGMDKGALRLTTALYHGPSGRSVQRTGVGPDIELLADADANAPRRREADRPQTLPGADEPAPPKASIAQSRCPLPRAEIDSALACAIAFLQTGRIETFVAGLGVAP